MCPNKLAREQTHRGVHNPVGELAIARWGRSGHGRHPKTPSVMPARPSSGSPTCAASSMPSARPERPQTPDCATSRAVACARLLPAVEGAGVPTIATVGTPAPRASRRPQQPGKDARRPLVLARPDGSDLVPAHVAGLEGNHEGTFTPAAQGERPRALGIHASTSQGKGPDRRRVISGSSSVLRQMQNQA